MLQHYGLPFFSQAAAGVFGGAEAAAVVKGTPWGFAFAAMQVGLYSYWAL
jgi:hypothetical protein